MPRVSSAPTEDTCWGNQARLAEYYVPSSAGPSQAPGGLHPSHDHEALSVAISADSNNLLLKTFTQHVLAPHLRRIAKALTRTVRDVRISGLDPRIHLGQLKLPEAPNSVSRHALSVDPAVHSVAGHA